MDNLEAKVSEADQAWEEKHNRETLVLRAIDKGIINKKPVGFFKNKCPNCKRVLVRETFFIYLNEYEYLHCTCGYEWVNHITNWDL